MQFSMKVLLFFTAWIAYVMGAVLGVSKLPWGSESWAIFVVACATGLVTAIGIIAAMLSMHCNRPFWVGFAVICAVIFFSGRMPDFNTWEAGQPAIPYLTKLIETRYLPAPSNLTSPALGESIARIITYGIVPIAGLAGGLITQWWVLRITKKGNPKN